MSIGKVSYLSRTALLLALLPASGGISGCGDASPGAQEAVGIPTEDAAVVGDVEGDPSPDTSAPDADTGAPDADDTGAGEPDAAETTCSNAPNGAACDDGDDCTTGDSCADGTCTGGSPADCDDGDACTTDSCAAGICQHEPAPPCDDGDACTDDNCAPETGCVHAASAPCDDGDPCTEDACAPETGCVSTPATGPPCDDGDDCTTGDSCADGTCIGGSPADCDDGDACTTDSCAAGTCQHAPAPPCDDGDACTDDSCAPETGCVHVASAPCDDGDPCTEDACAPETGCVSTPTTGPPCDDGDACTTADSCADGTCIGGSPADCDDGDACTTDSCAAGTCQHAPAPPCDDGDACTDDSCAPETGCVHVASAPCDDGDPCTEDSCVAETGCVSTPTTGPPCDDDDACTTADTCQTGACAGAALECEPPGPCEAAATCEDGACVYAPLADGLPCGTEAGQSCQSGVCLPPPPVEAIEVHRLGLGYRHTCLVRDDGSVTCWGSNEEGRLGAGTESTIEARPQDVQGLAGVRSVTSGDTFSCALTDAGGVWCWGRGNQGQLGDGLETDRSHPLEVKDGSSFVALSAGGSFGCAITSLGGIRCWGRGDEGQLGDGEGGDQPTPSPVTGITGAVSVAAGDQHACAVHGGGQVSCWGRGDAGQVGAESGGQHVEPNLVPGLGGAIAVAAGEAHSCALLEGTSSAGGPVACWGDDDYGQLGQGDDSFGSTTPLLVPGLDDAVEITAGDFFTCARRASGAVTCWGRNEERQLGADLTDSFVASPVAVLDLADATEVAAGSNFACALTASGATRCWGSNWRAQLGDGTVDRRPLPSAGVAGLWPHPRCETCDDDQPCTVDLCAPDGCLYVPRGDGARCARDGLCQAGTCEAWDPPQRSLTLGRDHGALIRADGTVASWGANDYGQLGIGDALTLLRTHAGDVPALFDVVALDAGNDFTCAVHTDGTVSCWGYGLQGQLGQGSADSSGVPVAVEGLTDAIEVHAGDRFACALTAGATVSCWGQSSDGQLGPGAPSGSVSVATPVPGLADVVDLCTGNKFACAITADGLPRCWGRGEHDKLGRGLTSSTATPSAVAPGTAGLLDARAIRCGEHHACAITAGGRVACWGEYADGRLGDGTTKQTDTPVEVSGVSEAADLALGYEHGCVVLTSGEVRCWGENVTHQLGTGDNQDQEAPVAIPGFEGAQVLTGGYGATCAGWFDGTFVCAGDNADGELAGGTTGDAKVPEAALTPSSCGAYCAPADAAETCQVATCGASLDCQVAPAADGTPCGPEARCAGGSCTASPDATRRRLVAGDRFTCALTGASGSAVCFGAGDSGQLGDGQGTGSASAVAVSGLSGLTSLAAGSRHACAVDATGQLHCWGRNYQGQLGDGTKDDSPTPVTVQELPPAVAVAAGGEHTCAIGASGHVDCWGLDLTGQLGNGAPSGDQPLPTATLRVEHAYDLALGEDHSCAVTAGGTLMCWGEGDAGRLGYGKSGDADWPLTVAPGPEALRDYHGVAAGTEFTCAVTAAGTVACFGHEDGGALGVDVPGGFWRYWPAQVPGLTDVVRLAAGDQHACAVTTAGALYCWGANDYGQLGLGHDDPVDGPWVVGGLPPVLEVATGERHTCALTASAVLCWGHNGDGQLGAETTCTECYDPVQALAY